jgi:hypothetical protein
MSQPSPETTGPSQCCPGKGIKYKDLSPEQKEVSDILRRMECDPYLPVYVHLGSDGVIRLLDADSNILHAEPLRPALIKGFLDRGPYDKEEEISFLGIDGTRVPKEQWYHPPEGIIPPPMPEDMKKEAQEIMEKNKEKLDKIRQDRQNGVHEERLVYLVSDHKIY